MKIPNNRHRRIWVGGALLALGVVAAALFMAPRLGIGSSKPGGDAKGKDKPPVPLEFIASEVARPVLARLPMLVEFSGPLVAPRTAVVRAKAPGTLLSLTVAEGSRVKAGQVIGEIDLADLQSRVSERSAMVESAQAGLLEAERQHTANVGLASQNFISSTALQTSQARLDAARAQLKSAQAQLSVSRIGVREAALAAPIAGIVGKRHVVPGEKVSAEQQIVTIVDLASLELAGAVGTHEVSLLRAGQEVEVRVEGQRDPVPGRIDRISPAADPGTRAIGVVVSLDNKGERFRAGQYAQARVSLVDDATRLTVPTGAVGQASGQDFVWTIENGALVRRIVITGRKDMATGRVEVSKGLDAQAQILAARFDNLKEGAPARVVAQRAAAAASAPGRTSASASSAPQS
ncbi:MAG: efflux RND transporter periplasmic adaptor subunit [Caldimonas sp.]